MIQVSAKYTAQFLRYESFKTVSSRLPVQEIG